MTKAVKAISPTIATTTMIKTAPRSESRVVCMLFMTGSLLMTRLLFDRAGSSRRVDQAGAAFEPVADAGGAATLALDRLLVLVDEQIRIGRQRRHLVRLERADQARRDEHHQLGLLSALRVALEQRPDDRQAAENRNRGGIVLRQVAHQPGDCERLPVA